jgi:hypothetical protein
MPRKNQPGGPCRSCSGGPGPGPGTPCSPCAIPDEVTLELVNPPSFGWDAEDLAAGICAYTVPMRLVDKPLHLSETSPAVVADRYWIAEDLCKRGGPIGFCPLPGGGVSFDYTWVYLNTTVLLYCDKATGRVTLAWGYGLRAGEAVIPRTGGDDVDFCADPGEAGSCSECGEPGTISLVTEEATKSYWRILPFWTVDAVGVCSCSPLDLEFRSPVGAGSVDFFEARVRSASAEGSACGPEPSPCPGGCWARVTWVELCPESCPSGAEFVYRDPLTEAVFGPFPWEYEDDGSGGCTMRRASARVCVPAGSDLARSYELLDASDPEGPPIATLGVVGCNPTMVVEGEPGGSAVLEVCVTGCPDPAPMTAGVVALDVRDAGGIVLASGAAEVVDGCALVPVRLPLEAGSYDVRVLYTPPDNRGYRPTEVDFEDIALPGRADTCQRVDVEVGTLAAAIHPDWICTCAGPAPKCLLGTGNGEQVQYLWDGGAWVAEESFPADPECGPPGDAIGRVAITLAEDCSAWVADRTITSCLLPGYYEECPPGSGNFMDVRAPSGGGWPASPGPTNTSAGRGTAPLTPWGPLGAFPSPTFSAWSRPNGDADPFNCFAPGEAYTPIITTPCDGVEGGGGGDLVLGMEAAAPAAADEPPLPSPLRMAAQLARTAVGVAGHAARTGQVKATPEEQARRWEACRACPLFRASERRCGGMAGCGCHLARKIPLAGARCPLTPPRWGPMAR